MSKSKKLFLALCLVAALPVAANAAVSKGEIQRFTELVFSSITVSSSFTAPFEDTTAANTLTAAECGKTIMLNSATEFATTLPAPSAGCRFKFIVKAAPASASYTIVSTSGADIIAVTVNELETDTADDGPYDDNADTVTFVDGVAVEGDFLDCISDGTKYYCNGQTNADGGITTATS